MYHKLLIEALYAWHHDHVPRLAASLSYYTLFSLAPLFLIVISLASVFFGEAAVREHILIQVSSLLGPQAGNAISSILEREPHITGNLFISTVGMVIVFLGATGVFGQLKSSLDTIWHVPQKKERTMVTLVEHNFLPFTMVLGTGFLLLVSLIITAVITAFSRYLGLFIPSPYIVLEGLNFIITLATAVLLFAFIYKILPDVNITWNDVWPGSFLTAVLFIIGKFLIGFYIGNSNLLSAYGTAGSIVVILIWVYYSAQILFFGAEFTKVYTYKYGSKKDEVQVSGTAKLLGGFLEGVVKTLKKEFSRSHNP